MEKLSEGDLNIIKCVLDIVNKSDNKDFFVKFFSEGTSSKVFLLNNKYIIKQNSEEIIKSELIFCQNNFNPLFQKLIFYDKNYKYIVYEYIEGENLNNFTNIDINILIDTLLNIINSYKITDIDYYGYVYNPKKTWEEFLKDEISDCQPSYNYIKNFNIDYECNILSKFPFEKRIIHGDFGAHNFLIKNNKLTGIIDPETIIGDNIYDILFAICSNPNILKYFNLNDIYKIIKQSEEKIKSLFKIILFSRITRAYHHHINDLNFYLNYYNTTFNI